MTKTVTNPPLISVITVSFNAADYIEQTIHSVLLQTYPHIEYIIIDGGSRDGTVAIIQKFEARLAYWHSKPDRGITHAFNLGLSQAHGDWIVFLNADDFFLDKSVIEKIAPQLAKNDEADVVFGQTILMTNEKDPKPLAFAKIYGYPWHWQKFKRFNTIPHPSSFTSRRYFDKVGTFNEKYRICMDYEFYLRAGKNLRAEFIPLAISGMREGGNSRENTINTFLEVRLANYETNALPYFLSWLNFAFLVGRHYVGCASHKMLDRFAHQLSWPGRNTGPLLKRISNHKF